jgi:predicted nucleic acid-binding protein
VKLALIDAGPIVAYYNQADRWHDKVKAFFSIFAGQFVTTEPILTEALWLLQEDQRVQNELLDDVSLELFKVENLQPSDYSRIAALNSKYKDLPADFGDLSLIAISERLNIADIASLDGDFDVYRRYKKKGFNRIFPD